MLTTLPPTALEFAAWDWARIASYIDGLNARPLTDATAVAWLNDWSHLARLVDEAHMRLTVATTQDTADAAAAERLQRYRVEIMEPYGTASQTLREKFLDSGVQVEGYAVPHRILEADALIYRGANLPLLTEEQALTLEYNRILGAQTVDWEGAETTIQALAPVYQDAVRAVREQAWHAAAARQLADRAALNDLWTRLLLLRRQIAANADQPDFRAYRWRALHRFDYTPDDCLRFHDAIETVVVPLARRLYERRRARLGVETLRPWDLAVDPLGRPPLRPYTAPADLLEGTARIFRHLDPQFGDAFDILRREGLLDLENRKGKAPGGYCVEYPHARRPFIFMNAVGLHDDVQTMLHEGGHAFHAFAAAALPFYGQSRQLDVPTEFAEVASMSMELLGGPYLARAEGGFYSAADTARARVEHLESIVLFWPYMAVVDAFQHWAYTHPDAADDPAQCDAQWAAQWARFMQGVDWSGLEAEAMTGWHRKLHIFTVPFYYVEYGLAQLGAVQVWRHSLTDPEEAVADYRRALALGNTVPLPALFEAAGARFTIDAATLGECVDLLMETIDTLEAVQG